MKSIYKIITVIGSLLLLCSIGASDLGCPNFTAMLTGALIGLMMFAIGLKGLKIIN